MLRVNRATPEYVWLCCEAFNRWINVLERPEYAGANLTLLGELTLCIGCRPRLCWPASSAAALNAGLSNLAVDTVGAGWLWRNANLRKATGDEMGKEGSAQNLRGQPEPGLALLTAAN